MPWDAENFPDAMKNLSDKIRKKAIEIAEALREKGMEEGMAIAIGISKAKKFVVNHPEFASVGSLKVRISTVDYLDPEQTATVSDCLNYLLAWMNLYALQLKQAHWNTKGMSFAGLHPLYDTAHEHAIDFSDLLAERVVQLGRPAKGSPDHIFAILQGASYDINADTRGFGEKEILQSVIHRGKELAKLVHNAAEALVDLDNTSADVVIEISRGLDKDLWQIEARLEGIGA